MLKQFAIGVILACGLALPAKATSTLLCTFADAGDITLTVGTVAGFGLVSAQISRGETLLTTAGENANLAIAQAFRENELVAIDFADANYMEISIRLRLFEAVYQDEYIANGMVWFPDQAYPVTCEEVG